MGFISPEDFILVAESSELIYKLDFWVIRFVCQQLKTWKINHVPLIPVAINLSAKQSSRDNLVSLIQQALTMADVEPQWVEVEITETSALNNVEQVAVNVNALRKMGIKVSIDDFGAGHASLSLLKYCRIDALKIDKSFIFNIHNSQEASIIEGIIALANTLQIKTVAEGVETEEQLELLKEMGCDTIQGYLLAKPMKKEDF